jgi:glycosyltransferase involved in cell wall biosynthesis/GT2 family glycosyltransferase
MTGVGIVVIGRNESERLQRCLTSVLRHTRAVVYVDSGSTDGSVAAVRARGVPVVELDMSVPFTAARARNAGFAHLLGLYPELAFVQFVDGDCELAEGWLEAARRALERSPEVAVTCGRLRERNREASVYNRLCDLEWDGPAGDVEECGGNAFVRVGPLRAVNGYRESLIAGEEPELCLRLRAGGWKVRRLAADMGLHDAAMTRFGQWWKRSVRGGHAFAECSWLHRSGPVRLWARQARSNWFWGLALPAAAVAAAPFFPLLSLALLLGYVLLGLRVYRHRRRFGNTPRDARLYAFFCVLGKFPQATGQLRYHRNRLLSRRGRLGQHKDAGRPGGEQPAVKVAYLVNQYPHVSHSFIRREIRALEWRGVALTRFSIRRPPVPPVDPADRVEQERTEVLLGRGLLRLAAGCLATLVQHPVRWLRAATLATRMGRRSGRGLYRHWAYLAEACALLRRLKRTGVRHLHAHFGTNATDVALLTRVLGGPPYSFTIHGPEEFDRPAQLSLGQKIERAAFVVAVSEFGRSQVFRWCPHTHWPKVHVIRCGVDEAFLGAGPQPVPDTCRIVCVGRLCEQKGQLRLLQALSELAADRVPFEMIFAGDGPMRPVIEEEVTRLGLADRVRITGWLGSADVRQQLLAARAMVLPSFAEGLPVVLMEALALGRPVVTCCVAGIPELVQPGVNGWLVAAGSVNALASALRQVLATPCDQLTRMGRAGAAKVAALHDVSNEAAALAALLGGAQPDAPERAMLWPPTSTAVSARRDAETTVVRLPAASPNGNG